MQDYRWLVMGDAQSVGFLTDMAKQTYLKIPPRLLYLSVLMRAVGSYPRTPYDTVLIVTELDAARNPV